MHAILMLLLASFAAHLTPRAPPAFCSVPFSGIVGDDAVLLLGEALPDTVEAGSGAIEWIEASGHFGPAGDGRPFGQLVAVEDIAGPGPVEAVTGHEQVVIVPWDYDGMCRSTLWGGSTRLLTPGDRVFFSGSLRAPEDWVEGRPTFDARRPGVQVYPLAARNRFEPRPTGSGRVASAADDLFELHQLLPTSRDLTVAPDRAALRAIDWARANPERAARDPVARILARTARTAEFAAARASSSPFAGTYRVTITLPSGATHTGFLRTSDRPEGPWYEGQAFSWFDEPREHPWELDVVGVRMPFWFGARREDLPSDAAGRAIVGQVGDLFVSSTAETPEIGAEWPGRIDLSGLRSADPSGPELDAFLSQYTEARRARMFDRSVTWRTATFTGEGDPSFRIDATVEGMGRALIVGTRISTRTVPSR